MQNPMHRYFVSYIVNRQIRFYGTSSHEHDHKDCFVEVPSGNDRLPGTIEQIRQAVNQREMRKDGESIVLLTWKWLGAAT